MEQTGGTLSTMEMRKKNRNRVYHLLVTQPQPRTRQELAKELGMSLPTLTQNIKELSEMGLIAATGTTDSTGGRRPRLISAVPDARFAVGVELTRRHIRLIAVDLLRNELAYRKYKRLFENSEAYGRDLAEYLEEFLTEHNLDRERLLGVGIALPGIISPERNTIKYATTLGILSDTPEHITGDIPYPHTVDNDATCGGLGEWDQDDQENMAYLSLGYGVGGAILMQHCLYEGTERRAAEFGHMCIHPGGKQCTCGKQGCLEAYCSSACLSEELGISVEEFFWRLEQGNPSCRARWEEYLDDLALAVSNIHLMLDCKVVVGRPVSQYLPVYEQTLSERLRKLTPVQNEKSYLAFASKQSRTNSFGAAIRYIRQFIEQI